MGDVSLISLMGDWLANARAIDNWDTPPPCWFRIPERLKSRRELFVEERADGKVLVQFPQVVEWIALLLKSLKSIRRACDVPPGQFNATGVISHLVLLCTIRTILTDKRLEFFFFDTLFHTLYEKIREISLDLHKSRSN